jgi:transposase InsO family protein
MEKTHLRTELVVDTLQMALWRRKPSPGLIHHCDQGVQYTSLSFGKKLEEAGLVPSWVGWVPLTITLWPKALWQP